jgi:uncharacterized membrane protein
MPGFSFGIFLRDQRGVTSVVTAISLVALMGVAALVIDTGASHFARRDQQAVTDAAAMAAVQNPASAASIAAGVFTTNGYQAPSLTVTAGTYSANESLNVANRFAAAATGINAVRVRASMPRRSYFAGFFGLGDPTVVTQATAARLPNVSFGAGTRLAALNAGILNSLLAQLWGSSVSLQLIDYQALTSTNIDALKFLNRLATDVNVSGSYQNLAQANVTTGQLLNALIAVSDTATGSNASAALLALRSLQAQLPGGTSMLLSNVLDLSPLNGRTIGNIASIDGQGLQLNLMSLLSASARTVSAGRLINVGNALTVPVTNSAVTTRIAVGSQMAQVSAGRVGSSIHTAQVRVAINAVVASVSLGSLAGVRVEVPLFLEGASGQATLTALPCTRGGTLAQIAARTGATSLRFGTVSDAALQNFAVPVTPVATPVASVTLLGFPVQIHPNGNVNVASSGPTTMNFSQADIDAGTVKSAPYGSASPFQTLGANFTTSVTIGGSPGILTNTLNNLIAAVLAPLGPLVASLISPLDAPVNSLLTALGLQLGIIDVRAFDVRCRAPTLVG